MRITAIITVPILIGAALLGVGAVGAQTDWCAEYQIDRESLGGNLQCERSTGGRFNALTSEALQPRVPPCESIASGWFGDAYRRRNGWAWAINIRIRMRIWGLCE